MNTHLLLQPPSRYAIGGAAALLLLVSACSTIAPPADPVVVTTEPPAVVEAAPAPAMGAPVASPKRPTRATARPTGRRSTAPIGRATAAPVAPGTGADPGVGDDDDRDDDETPIAGPEPKLEPLASHANRPYRLRGRHYRPMTELRPFRQRGIASWYGRPFHGRKTAIGERYDMNAMTAAHPTLPLPSYARVRNLKNGHVVIVRVNDRGPFAQDRILDVSHAAARHLGFADGGIAVVEIDLVVPDPAEEALAAPVADARR